MKTTIEILEERQQVALEQQSKAYEDMTKQINDVMTTYFRGLVEGMIVEGGTESWTLRDKNEDRFYGEYCDINLVRDYDFKKSEYGAYELEISSSSIRGREDKILDKMIANGKVAELVKKFGNEIIIQILALKDDFQVRLNDAGKAVREIQTELEDVKRLKKQRELKDFETELHSGVDLHKVDVEKRYNQIYRNVKGIKIVEFNKSGKRVTLEITQVYSEWNSEHHRYDEIDHKNTIEILTVKMKKQLSYWRTNLIK